MSFLLHRRILKTYKYDNNVQTTDTIHLHGDLDTLSILLDSKNVLKADTTILCRLPYEQYFIYFYIFFSGAILRNQSRLNIHRHNF